MISKSSASVSESLCLALISLIKVAGELTLDRNSCIRYHLVRVVVSLILVFGFDLLSM